MGWGEGRGSANIRGRSPPLSPARAQHKQKPRGCCLHSWVQAHRPAPTGRAVRGSEHQGQAAQGGMGPGFTPWQEGTPGNWHSQGKKQHGVGRRGAAPRGCSAWGR